MAGAAAAMTIGGAATSVPPEALLEPLARPLDVALVAAGNTVAVDLLRGGIEYMTSFTKHCRAMCVYVRARARVFVYVCVLSVCSGQPLSQSP